MLRLGIVLLPLLSLAQVPGVLPPSSRQFGEVSGVVLSDLTGRPLQRALVVLTPLDATLLPRLATTNETGAFSFLDVPAGRYTFVVQRDGYLSVGGHGPQPGNPPDQFTVTGNTRLGSFVFRLRPTAVIAGHVKYSSDAEPAVGAVVEVYREHRVRARHGFALAARAVTDDRGEYRIHGLTPGSYYIAAIRQRPPEAAGAIEEPRRDAQGRPLPDEAFALTFYPNGQKLVDAVPVHITYGSEILGTDIFLESVPSVRIRGRVTTPLGVPESLSIEVHRADARDGAAIRASYDVAIRKHSGEFEIQDVTAGPYVLKVEATAGPYEFTARRFLEVTNTPVENLEILVEQPLIRNGSVVVTGVNSQSAGSVHVSLEPREEDAGVASAITDEKGRFSVTLLPGVAYDVLLSNLPENTHVRAVRDGNSVTDPIEVVLGTDSAKITGNVVDRAGLPAAEARVTLIPDPPEGRWQQYSSAAVATDGSFVLTGIAPGHYLILASPADPPCDIYDPADMAACRRQATPINLETSGQAFLALQLP